MGSYGESYYTQHMGSDYRDEERWAPLFQRFAQHIVTDFAPKTVLDIGCAFGYIVKYLRELGVEAWGIDTSAYAISQAAESVQPYLRVSSACEPLPSDLPVQFDLVLNIEVLEHLTQRDGELALARMCTYSNTILFSSTGEDYDNPTHVNVQQPEYWAELFAAQGFYKNLTYNMDYLSKYAAQYEKKEATFGALVRTYERAVRYMRYCVEKEQSTSGKLAQDIETVREQRATDEAYFRREIDRLTKNIQQQIEEITTLSQRLHLDNDEYAKQLAAQKQALAVAEKKLQEEMQRHQEAEQGQVRHHQEIEQEQGMLHQKALQKQAESIQNLTEQVASFSHREHTLKSQLNAAEQNSLALNAQIQALSSSLTQISNERDVYFENARCHQEDLQKFTQSRGYAVLCFYYRLRDVLLPKGSRRRRLIKRIFKRTSKCIVAHEISAEESFYTWEERARQDWCRQNPLDEAIRFSIVTPVFNTPLPVLEAMIFSVKNQIYSNWELCIADASPEKEEIRFMVEQMALDCPKIKYTALLKNEGISKNTITALEMATGDFIALLDHDDIIAPNALYEYAARLQDDPKIDFFYSDKDMIDEAGSRRMNPLYKPDYSPEIMYSANYLTHFNAIRKTVLENTDGFDAKTDGAQDWDIFLKVMSETSHFCHVEQILYHWRILSTSVASGAAAKPYALDAQLCALSQYVRSREWPAQISFYDRNLSMIKVDWRFKDTITVAVICFSNSHTASITLPGSCVENVTVLWEDTNLLNKVIGNSTADVLVFVDADACIGFSDTILSELSAWAMHPEIGFVAPQLRAEGTIVSCGLLYEDTQVMDLFAGQEVGFYGQMGHSEWYRNLSCFRGTCLAIEREKFVAQCQYKTAYKSFSLAWNCFNVLNSGLRNVYNYFAWVEVQQELLASEATLSQDFMQLKCTEMIAERDPYLNYRCTVDVHRKPLNVMSENHPPIAERLDKYTSDALALASAFSFTASDLAANQKVVSNRLNGETKTMVWFLQEFDYVFYAGLYTIFRTAEHLQAEHQIQHTFVFISNTEAGVMMQRVADGFPLLASCAAYSITSPEEMDQLKHFDASVCTLWTTAYYSLKFNKVMRKFYFIQDYEPLFYPAGSTYAQAEATYRFGFYGIANTLGLQTVYQNEFAGTAVSLDPSVDTTIFYPNPTRQYNKRPYTVFFYGRPGHPRNGFELGVEALKRLKKRMGNRVRIVTAGASYRIEDYGLDGIIENLGRLKVEETGDLYRSCDAGLVMMYTRHPSYLPYELMACGCCVVSNYNAYTTWFLKNEENSVVCEASADSIAESIEDILKDGSKRKRIAETGAAQIIEHNPQWHESLERVARFIQNPES